MLMKTRNDKVLHKTANITGIDQGSTSKTNNNTSWNGKSATKQVILQAVSVIHNDQTYKTKS